MSTILDALKKVERERRSPRDQLLDLPPPGPKSRRRLSANVIVACAALGFAAGIGLALWRDAPPSEVAQLPNMPPPPVIEVPEPPPITAAGEDSQEIVTGPATATDEAPPVEEQQPEQVASAPSQAVPPAQDAGSKDSALEPWPFAPPRGANPGPESQVEQAGSAVTPPKVPQPAPPPAGELAAIEPPVPALPPEQTIPVGEPEEPPVQTETVIDTGRSPPGAPRVSLSFLQWSADPSRRFAFVSIDGAPSQRVREGDATGGLIVKEITPTGVQFKQDGRLFTIRTRH